MTNIKCTKQLQLKPNEAKIQTRKLIYFGKGTTKLGNIRYKLDRVLRYTALHRVTPRYTTLHWDFYHCT